MARDNSPQRRQQKKLERKINWRAPYDRILIVCEGEKTEPLYFKEIRQYHRLQTANVEVVNSSFGTSPQQVVDYAVEKCKDSLKWEQVYCVFDRDNHSTFDSAIASVERHNSKYKNDLKKTIKFTAIFSNPNFELWLLLHFICMERNLTSKETIKLLKAKDKLPELAVVIIVQIHTERNF